MYGYIRQGRRTALTRELIGGVAFQVLTVGTGPLRRVRASRLLRCLAGQGVSAAVFEDGAWREAAARYGIHPVPVGALRLAKLEKQGKLKAVVTQNIDGLHQAAGSKTVYELHGSTLRNYCTRCGAFYDVDYIANSTGVPRCEKCGGIVKPDVVLYEEGLDEEVLSGAVNAIRHADTLIIGGTSLVVYPAAGLIRYFRGDHLVVINMQPTGADAQADLCIAKPIGQVLSEDVVLE